MARYPNTLNGYPKMSKKLRVGRLTLNVSSVARVVQLDFGCEVAEVQLNAA